MCVMLHKIMGQMLVSFEQAWTPWDNRCLCRCLDNMTDNNLQQWLTYTMLQLLFIMQKNYSTEMSESSCMSNEYFNKKN